LARIDGKPVSLAELAKTLGWLMKTGDPYKMMVKRTLDTLKTAKLITLERDVASLTQKGEKALKQLTGKGQGCSTLFTEAH
jgi:Mn-dependent DtxR family transcriptional regulator